VAADLKLFMVLLGCRPEGRLTEQHDLFFGVGSSLSDLAPQMQKFWPGVRLHIDAYQVVERVDKYDIQIGPSETESSLSELKLFFINLGAYRPPEFEEYHRKLLFVASDISEAIALSKQDALYRAGQHLPSSARSHVDDKLVVDEVWNVGDLLSDYRIEITPATEETVASEPVVGYIPFARLTDGSVFN
jgi:hypothetical protein